MWVNFTVRSVKPLVRGMERWGAREAGRKDCKWGVRVLRARAQSHTCSRTQMDRHMNTSVYTDCRIYVHILKEQWEREHTCAHRNADAHTLGKIGCVCKQSPHQSLSERSKSSLAVAPFHVIPQPSDAIPTSHLHIKQGSHSHTLTNDFWMLLALYFTTALQTCTVVPPWAEATKKALSSYFPYLQRTGFSPAVDWQPPCRSLYYLFQFWPTITEWH